MPLNKFIVAINVELKGLVPDIKLFGIVQSITRTIGNETESLPGIVSDSGEITYVGIDDIFSVMVYHKQNRITTTRRTQQGFGDKLSDIINAYQLSMVIYLDRSKVNITADELFLYIQANVPGIIKIEPYKQVLVRLNTVILNVEQIFSTEYKGAAFKLPAEKTLLQIDYTIESTFKPDCFDKCPEGLTC